MSGARHAAQNVGVQITRPDAATGVNDPGIGRGALRDQAILVHKPGFLSALLFGRLLRQDIRKEGDRLDVATGPTAPPIAVTTAAPLDAAAFKAAGLCARAVMMTLGKTSAPGKA